eukprot:5682678-Prorocentrum_lima.AAC.1
MSNMVWNQPFSNNIPIRQAVSSRNHMRWSPLSSNGCACRILKEILCGSGPMALREEHPHTK